MFPPLLSEFDNEMAVTRRLIERAPQAAFAWTPHERSRTLGALVTHLAQIPHWGNAIITRDEYDLVLDAEGRGVEYDTPGLALLAFDGHVKTVRRGLAETTDAILRSPWMLKKNGHVVMSMPRLAALRSFLINHTIHHRGQLSVYLRLQNVSLPPIYGPTADES